jgi:hypothetical protein
VAQPLESLADVLMQAVGRHVDEGRAPRSSRRVVRAASSRDGPLPSGDDDPDPEPDLVLARQRRAVRGWPRPWEGSTSSSATTARACASA